MVRWCNDHLGIRIFLKQRICSIGDAGCRIATDWLTENLLLGKLWDVLHHKLLVALICYYYEVLYWDNIGKSLECVTDERASRAEYVEELLWTLFATHRPEACAYATRHNYTIAITLHCFLSLKFYKIYTKIKLFLYLCKIFGTFKNYYRAKISKKIRTKL